jgi:glycosyltransferase involved in cell wall biosynthesis
MNRAAHVLHIYHDFWPVRGGIEDYLAGLSRAQSANGVEVSVLCANDQPRTLVEWVGDVRVIRARAYGRFYTPFCPSWPLWVRRLRPDLVHLHLPDPVGEWSAWLTRPRTMVVSLHNDYVRPEWAVRLHRPLHRGVLRRAGAIIVGAPDYARSSVVLRDLQNHVRIVPYGIEADRYSPGSGMRAGVLFAGRLCYYKGVEVLLAAASSVEALLTIVGDGPCRRRLEMQARRLCAGKGRTYAPDTPARSAGSRQPGGHVRFLGALSESELIERLQSNRVFAFPSTGRAEAFGIAQLKAMACGLPVVSSDLPGVAWLNRHEESGLHVPVRNPAALAVALNRLLFDNELWNHLSAGAVARAHEFDLRRTVAATQHVYAEVMSGT